MSKLLAWALLVVTLIFIAPLSIANFVIGAKHHEPSCARIDVYVLTVGAVNLFCYLIATALAFYNQEAGLFALIITRVILGPFAFGAAIWGSIVTYSGSGMDCRDDHDPLWILAVVNLVFQYIYVFHALFGSNGVDKQTSSSGV